MIQNGQCVGVLALFRQEVRLFSDKQIALMQNFAAQAVMSGIDSTVPVASRIAYSRRSAGASCAVWPMIAQPALATARRYRSGSGATS